MLCLKCEFACMMELLSFQRGELQDSLYEFGAARKRGRGKSQVRAVVISLNQKWKQKTTEQLTVTSVFQWLLCLQNAHRLQAEVEMQHQCWVHALTHQHPVQSWGTRPQPGLQQCGIPPPSPASQMRCHFPCSHPFCNSGDHWGAQMYHCFHRATEPWGAPGKKKS